VTQPTDPKLKLPVGGTLPQASELARLAQELGTARQLLDVFRALRVYIESVTGSNALFVSLLDPAEQLRRCVYAWSDGAEVEVADLPPLPLSGGTPHARAVATGEVVIDTDLQSIIAETPNVALGYDRDPRHPNVSVALPLAVLGRVIGGFEIQLFQHADARSSIPALQVAANLAAAAIENVRLLEQERDLRLSAEASERRYRWSEQRLRLALEAAGLGTWEHDLSSGTFSWSPGTGRLFAQVAEQQPHSWSELLELVHPDDRAVVDNTLGRSMHDEGTRELEFRVADVDGAAVWLACRASTSIDAAGGGRRILGVVLNVTARKQGEQQREALAHSEQLRTLGQMASGIAHDLNQKLALISGYAELAREELAAAPAEPDTLEKLLAVIVRAAQDGGRTLQQLLAYARAHQPEEFEPLDLAELLGEVAELTAPRWRGVADAGRPIDLELAVPSATHLVIEGSRSALREAFTNLIFNAVDALVDGGTIRLRVSRVGDRVQAEVSDTGHGIPPELQARIFEPFFTTKGEHGTGLGLAQVAGVMARHGGQLSLDSAPDRGTTFRLSFPEAQRPAAPSIEKAVQHVAARAWRVLAVDDEPKLRAMIEMMLHPQGHQVIQAASGEEALKLLEASGPFDLVISDVSMGSGMTGWDLADRVHERWPGLVVALASGWGAQIDPEEAQRRGVAFVLAKPFRMANLRDLVAGLSHSASDLDG